MMLVTHNVLCDLKDLNINKVSWLIHVFDNYKFKEASLM